MPTVPSPPSRGAWIEIDVRLLSRKVGRSPPSRGAWIEMQEWTSSSNATASPPSRGAWIEIYRAYGKEHIELVAPLAGGVD